MLQFLKIIFLNAWRGARRANVLPAVVLVLASIGVLFVGSNAAASGSVHDAAHAITQAATHVRQMALGEPTDAQAAVMTGSKPKSKHHTPVVADKLDTNGGTKQSTSSSASQVNSNSAAQTASVQLTAGQSTCAQGQTAYTIASALFTLPTPTTADGTLTYYWETRIDSGTNSSGQPPISTTQTSQDLPAGSSQATLSGSQSQPFVSAPTNTNYAYSFRLHVLVGSTDTISAWVSVPQATGTCAQNQG